MARYSVATTKDKLSSLIDKALAGEEVIITRHGKPTVVLRVADEPVATVDVKAATARLEARLAGRPSPRAAIDVFPRMAVSGLSLLTIYLDASVLVALIGAEDGSQAAIDFVGNATEQLVVSDFAIGEVASAISRLVRMGKIDSTAGVEHLDIFDEWTATAATALPTGESDIRLATQLVRRFSLGVRMPDAIHLASAQIRGFTLATIDRRMAMNAEQLRMDFVVPEGRTG